MNEVAKRLMKYVKRSFYSASALLALHALQAFLCENCLQLLASNYSVIRQFFPTLVDKARKFTSLHFSIFHSLFRFRLNIYLLTNVSHH